MNREDADKYVKACNLEDRTYSKDAAEMFMFSAFIEGRESGLKPGMNIIEALATGKPIRRPLVKFMGSNGDGYLENDFVKSYLLHGPYLSGLTQSVRAKPSYALDEEDLLANDWEVQTEPPPKDVKDMTRKELEEFVKGLKK